MGFDRVALTRTAKTDTAPRREAVVDRRWRYPSASCVKGIRFNATRWRQSSYCSTREGAMTSSERDIEEQLLQKLRELKYGHRADIRDREALERNFREKFQAL